MSIVQIWSRHNIEELGISFFALSAFGVVRRDLFRIRSKAIAVFISASRWNIQFSNCDYLLTKLEGIEEPWMIWELHISGLDCADHDQRVEEDCKTRKTEFNHHIFVQKLKMTRGSSDLYRNFSYSCEGEISFLHRSIFCQKKGTSLSKLGGRGGLSIWRLLLIVPAPFTTCIQGFVFLGFTLSTYSHIMQVLKFRFMRERIFFHLLFIIWGWQDN